MFGVNDISASLFPILFSLLNVIVVFLIGEKLFDKKTALIGSILLIFYPLDVIHASFLGPDGFTPLFSSLVVYCYLIGEEKKHTAGHGALFYILSGFLIGLSVSARETSIFLFAVLLLHQIITRKKLTLIFWIFIGLAIPLIGEAAYYYLISGDPSLRLNVLDNLKWTIKSDYQKSAGSLLYYPKAMFGLSLEGWAVYGLTWWMVLAGLLLSGYKRDKHILLLAIWTVLPFLGFEFGLQSFKEMTDTHFKELYLSCSNYSAGNAYKCIFINGDYKFAELGKNTKRFVITV